MHQLSYCASKELPPGTHRYGDSWRMLLIATLLMLYIPLSNSQYENEVRRLAEYGAKEIEVTYLHLQKYHRFRRSSHNADEIEMHLTYSGEHYSMSLSPTNHLLHPAAVILTSNNISIPWLGDIPKCIYSGVVTSHNGKASISTCDVLSAIIRLKDCWLHVEAVGGDTSDESKIRVIVGKIQQDHRKYNKEISQPLSPRKQKRSVPSTNITVELAVYADAAYTSRLQSRDVARRVQHMLLKYNAVQMEWSRLDMLGYNVTFVIKRIQFFETDPEWYTRSNLLGTLLSDFCKGTGEDGTYDIRYFHTGLTGLDVSGRAYQSSACNQRYNCGVDKDIGAASYMATAHEIGHSLGMFHDDVRGCTGDDIGLMGGYGAGWSTCNKNDLDKFLQSGEGSCLWEENVQISPNELEKFQLEKNVPGQLYSPDEICELKYGLGHRFRKFPLLNVCTMYSCADHNKGATYGQMFKETSSIHGMYCAEGKICFKSSCVEPDLARQTHIMEREGGWGAWGQWTGCSRTCGRGVNLRQRKCDNPTPVSFLGCDGEAYEAMACNVNACSRDSSNEATLRNQRASESCEILRKNGIINSTLYTNTGSRYSYMADGQCEVKCAPVSGYTVPGFTRFGFMPDGTPCNNGLSDFDSKNWPRKSGSYFMCIDGHCEIFGCDDKYHGAKYDACGVCGGDNSSCNAFTAVDTQQQEKGERRIIARIPANSSNIQFWFTYTSMKQHFLELYSQSDEVVISSWIQWIWDRRTISFAASQWNYYFGDQYLYTEGPLNESCIVKLYKKGDFNNSGVHLAYSEPKPVSFDCDFEDGFCGWSNDNWLRSDDGNQGMVHPQSAFSGDTYIYITNNRSSLTTENVIGSSKTQCLIFSYYMKNISDGNLFVEMKSESGVNIWQKDGIKDQEWECASVNITTLQSAVITFIGTLGSSTNGSIALDGIHLFSSGHDCNAQACEFFKAPQTTRPPEYTTLDTKTTTLTGPPPDWIQENLAVVIGVVVAVILGAVAAIFLIRMLCKRKRPFKLRRSSEGRISPGRYSASLDDVDNRVYFSPDDSRRSVDYTANTDDINLQVT